VPPKKIKICDSWRSIKEPSLSSVQSYTPIAAGVVEIWSILCWRVDFMPKKAILPGRTISWSECVSHTKWQCNGLHISTRIREFSCFGWFGYL
jgi:hypothetical protein